MKNSTGTVDVGAATGSVGTGTDQDWFAVELETAKRYQIDLEGVDTRRGSLPDPVLELFDATGTSLSASDDDGGVGKNARLIYTPSAAGAYHVQASKRSGSGGGTYTLSVIHLGANGVSEADTDFSDDTSTSGRVEVGGPVTGTVTAANVIDWFAVDLEAGRRYRIDLEGADTNRGTLPDPVLWQILAPGDNLIYDDDDEVGDSGQGANSRMFSLRTWTAPTTWSRKLEGPQIETMLEAPTRCRCVTWRRPPAPATSRTSIPLSPPWTGAWWRCGTASRGPPRCGCTSWRTACACCALALAADTPDALGYRGLRAKGAVGAFAHSHCTTFISL